MALTKVRLGGLEPQYVGRRNLIINGAMQVAQRGTSATGKTANGYYTCDRFDFLYTSMGTWSFDQSTTVPSGKGFSNSLKLTCTSADASPAAADKVAVQYHFEGQDLQQLKYGTSDASSLTLSFWVRASKTGTYVVNFLNKDNSRQNSQTYNIATADTWQYVTISIDGDTSQGFDNDTGNSLEVNFYLGAGTNNTSGTLQNSWGADTAANRAVGQVNLADTDNATWFITGVQLEVGSVATPFEHRSFGEEKKLCQRYYFQTESQTFTGVASSAARLICGYRIPDMRATPTFTFISFNGTEDRLSKASNNADTTFANASVISLNGIFQIISSSTFTAGEGYFAQLKCDAEL